MSDNIDYDELDRAVNEAIRSRAASIKAPAKPVVKKTTTINVAKNTTAHPTSRPTNHGQYMDFVAKRPLSHAPRPVTPIAKPVAGKPVVKRVLQPQPARPIANTASRSAMSSATRPASRPIAHHVARPAAKPVTSTTAKPIARPTARPAQKPVTSKAVLQPKPAPTPKVAPATVKPAEPKAPNANNYSLGGRSPFMLDTKVDKRPLGTNIPEINARTLRSTHNVYSQKDPSTAKQHKAKKHVITEAPKKRSGWLWTLIVILIIAAGAGLGYLAYHLVFEN